MGELCPLADVFYLKYDNDIKKKMQTNLLIQCSVI